MDWPNVLPAMDHPACVSTLSAFALGPGMLHTAIGAGAWPSANRAHFVPFRLPRPETVCKLACGTGTGTTGNFDLGIYDAGGNRMVSSGSTAKTTATSERIVDVTDTLLLPGLYYLAMATDGVTNYLALGVNAAFAKLMGAREVNTAFALPSTVTFATNTGWVPYMAAYFRGE